MTTIIIVIGSMILLGITFRGIPKNLFVTFKDDKESIAGDAAGAVLIFLFIVILYFCLAMLS